MLATPRSSLAFLLLFPSYALAQTAATYDGSAHQTTVSVPRLTAEVRVDGVLDEPVWSQAARLSGFSEYRPVDSRPAEDSTVVLVFYSPTAIHFGIRAYEAHGNVVRATLADRDNIGADDRVQLLLDTYDDKRRALLFAVNPLGVQQDGVQSEGFDPSQSAGGRFDGIVDISPDFNFDSRGHVTPWGYEVEVRIPFKSLRYQTVDPQSWGLQIKRFTQHSGHEDTWTPAVRANASFLVQSGELTGLTGLRRGLVLEVDPEFTSSVAGTPGVGDTWNYGTPTADIGGNVRWGVTPNYTVNATVNPDFSQVESDVGQVTVNERFALFFPEKRPFFLDGLEQYDTPNRLIYTRQINAPLGGIKLTGKSGGTAIAYLGAADDRQYSDDRDVPIFNLLRIRKDIGTSSTIGAVHTDRIDGNDYNRVSGADARVIWRKIWYSQAQIAGAWTRDARGARNGALWDVTFADRTGRAYGNHFSLAGISNDFETRSGFVPRTGIVSGAAANRFSLYGKPGAPIEQLTTFIVASPVWLYDEFGHGSSFEGSVAQTITASLRGGWSLRANIGNSYQRFDSLSYGGYRVVNGVDTTLFRQPHGQYGLWTGSAGVSTPNRALAFSFDAGYGENVIFAEAARGRFRTATLTSSWHPNASLRVDASLVHQRITRERLGSRFSTATIPRIKTEYQLTRAIFLRYIGQYVAQDRSPLVDARTGLPLVVVSTGTPFGPTSALVLNDFRNDFLFSYKPTPGTVFFFGYGASLTEPTAFAFQTNTMHRVSDGFFLKASYRYRL